MSSEKFVHLHNHSHYSLLDGLSSPEDLVECAINLGFKSLALTDHGTCAGLYHFQKICLEKNIKPILGMEAYSTFDHNIKDIDKYPTHHLILIAKNKVGYKNLIKLSSLAFIQGFYYRPRIDFDLLCKYKEGLIVSSACSQGEIPYLLWHQDKEVAKKTIEKYKDVFKDDFYLELMIHEYLTDKEQEKKERKLSARLYSLAKEMGIKAICTTDTHYANSDEWNMHDILLSIQTRTHIKNPKRFSFDSKDFYLKSYEEMEAIYSKAPDTLLNTLEIAEKVESGIISPEKDLLPPFDLPEGYATEADFLKALVKTGMQEKGLINKPEYRERVKYEMGVITKCKYEKYFLILWDIINFAKRQNIRWGIGRGSAVSSLCLYSLGITKLDPIKHDLIFERFLNLDRISPPDVDLDFDYYKRDQIYEYLGQKYGSEHNSKIGTYNSYKARAAIRFTAKALDIGNDWERYLAEKQKHPDSKVEMTKKSLDLADEISKTIPLKAKNIQEALSTVPLLTKWQDRYPELFKAALYVEGVLASAGVHPAGTMVCKDPVIEHIPLRTSHGSICSQYDMSEVEELGLLKFDILALKTLTVIDETVKLIKKRHPDDQVAQNLDVDLLDPVDRKVFAVLNGENPLIDTQGIFQLEGYGMSQLLKKIHVDTFEDIVVANALFRPGPLQGGVHDLYCAYKHKQQEIQYLHPKMENALKDTYGIMIYQENVMKVAVELAGFTKGQADVLRYAVGKKKEKLMKTQLDLFVQGCIKNGIAKDVAEKIFAQIDFFSGYGFNKCLSGDTKVLNKLDNKVYDLKQLSNGSYGLNKKNPVILDSMIDDKIIEDELVEVFETGEKEIYEIELTNGMIVKCTLDHKFYCSDGKSHTVKEILDNDFEIVYNIETSKNMLKCKIKSIKAIGKQMTYNVTMKGHQHNYKIIDVNKNMSIITSNSHAAAYAFLAYQTAYLKTHYFLEFMCNLLTSEIDNSDKGLKLESYMSQVTKNKYRFLPPNINKSCLGFSISRIKVNHMSQECIRRPISMIKGVGAKAVEEIMAHRPYSNLKDFLSKVDGRKVTSAVFKALVEAGCFDEEWKDSKDNMMSQYTKFKEEIEAERKAEKKKEKAIKSGGGGNLFENCSSS